VPHRLPHAAALAALLAASPAALAAEGEPPALSLESRVTALAGGSSGLGTRTDSGGRGLLEISLVPALRRGTLEVKAPIRLERDQTVGMDLTETTLAGALAPEWRVRPTLRLGAEAGARRVWRLGWPDPYQPDPADPAVSAPRSLLKTDRYSYTALHAGASAYLKPERHHHLRARWRVVSYDYQRDPAFDETDVTPTHLTPRDNVRNDLDLSWRYVAEAWALAARLDSSFRRDKVYPARRARSGAAVPFSHQALNDYEPRVELELRRLAPGLKASLELGWAVRDDTFEGYYSYAGPHPQVVVEWAATERLSLAAGAQAWWLRYGPDARASTEDGKRLYDHRGEVKGEVRYALGRGVALLGQAAWQVRTTNYPDYVPGAFPSTRNYDVSWDYTNTRALVGAEWRR
jgi:hypothetical protein